MDIPSSPAELESSVPEGVDPRAFAAYLGLLLLVGAANADASPKQREYLKRVPDLLRQPGTEPRKVGAYVLEVMGSRWVPSGEWATAIASLQSSAREEQAGG